MLQIDADSQKRLKYKQRVKTDGGKDMKMENKQEMTGLNGRFHNIRDEYKINFMVPEILKNLMLEAEEADMRNDGSYDNLADTIDVYAKNSCADGLITEAQWDYIVTRYPQG